jgi:hypothetical protein
LSYRLSKSSAVLSTRIPIQQAEALRRVSEAHEKTISQIIGDLIEHSFADDELPPQPHDGEHDQ